MAKDQKALATPPKCTEHELGNRITSIHHKERVKDAIIKAGNTALWFSVITLSTSGLTESRSASESRYRAFSGYVLNSSFSEALSQLFCAQNVFRPCYLMFGLVSIVGKAFLSPFLVMFLYACGEHERLYRRIGYIESQDMFGSGHVICA